MYQLLELLEKCFCGLFSFNGNSQNTSKIHPKQKPPTIFLDQSQLDTYLMQEVHNDFAAKQQSATFISHTENSKKNFKQLVIEDIQEYISEITGDLPDAIIIHSPRKPDPDLEPDDNNKPSP